MWIAIVILIITVWNHLSALTIALRFGTALIAFIIAVLPLVRHFRSWSRTHR